MFETAVAALLVACVGAPMQVFAPLQQRMLAAGLYEDLCEVSSSVSNASVSNASMSNNWLSELVSKLVSSNSAIAGNTVLCAEMRTAYANVYSAGMLAFALAFAPAYGCVAYIGFSATNLALCFLLAAGLLVLSNGLTQDPFLVGFALIAASSAFALLNALSVSLAGGARARQKLLVLMAAAQLSPIAWAFANYLPLPQLLWAPTIAVLLTLATMPFTLSSGLDFRNLRSFLGAMSSEPEAEGKCNCYTRYTLLIAAAYTVAALPLNLAELAPNTPPPVYSVLPALGFLFVLSAPSASSHLLALTETPLLLSVAHTLAMWFVPQIGAIALPVVNIALGVAATAALTAWHCDSVKQITLFLLTNAMLTLLTAPPATRAAELGAPNYMPFPLALGLQFLVLVVAHVCVIRKTSQDRREQLEREAREAFNDA